MSVDEINGRFGEYGGRFVPEALIGALNELEAAHISAHSDSAFLAELAQLHRTYTGRPSIITEVPRFGEYAGFSNNAFFTHAFSKQSLTQNIIYLMTASMV